MINRRKLLLPAAIAAALSFSIAASGATVPSGVTLAETQAVTFTNGAEPSSLDPHHSESNEDFRIERDMFEGLVVQDDHGAVTPGLAESWTSNDNYTQFTFNIRDGAHWSNGETITAEDFVNSWRRLADPKTASPYSWYLEMSMIENAGEIINGKKAPETLGVKALDEHTLQVNLSQPVPYFLNMISLTCMSAVPVETIEKYGHNWTQPENIVTSGAYKLDEWVVNERVTLQRNSEYWNDNKTIINKVNFLPISGNSELNRYKAGEVHVTRGVPEEHYRALKKQRPDELVELPTIATFYYIFNMDKAPYNDVRVRKALSYAIDRSAITEKVLGMGQQNAFTFTPEIVYGYTPPAVEYSTWTQKERDQKARELLAEAGYSKNNPLKVELLYNTHESNKRQAVVMAQMWKKIGVETTLLNQEYKTLLDNAREGNFEILRMTWNADYNEASTMLDVLTTPHGQNSGHYSNLEYDRLVASAKLAPTEQERNALYTQAEEIEAQDMPIIPVFHLTKNYLRSTKVGGIPMHNPQNTIYTRDLYLMQ